MQELEEVRSNDFNVDRDLLAYQDRLGTEFTAFLHTLGADAHWVDAGAGRARAALEYLALAAPATKARVTAVVLNPPEGFDVPAVERAHESGGFRYLHGQPVEELSVEVVGRADLITDVYGPLQYTRQIDGLMEYYGRLLKEGGRLWAVLPAITNVRDGDREVPLAMWFARIRGFRPLRLPVSGLPGLELVMIRTDEPVHAPRLFLNRVAAGAPPLREYLLLD